MLLEWTSVEQQAEAIARVALLNEPTRRELYEYVLGRGRAVGRDEAARAVGISRGLAAFHLDRLVDAKLLEVEYRRLTGRTGRGAGRPAKLYRAGEVSVQVSIPETRYELAGSVLVTALAEGERSKEGRGAVRRSAQARGVELGRTLAGHISTGSALSRAQGALDELGFRPERRGEVVRPRNCPFLGLVKVNSDLVCSLNLAFLDGLVDGLGCQRVMAEVDPEPAECCVRLRGLRSARPSSGDPA